MIGSFDRSLRTYRTPFDRLNDPSLRLEAMRGEIDVIAIVPNGRLPQARGQREKA
jgi:hypothetical protein